VSVPVGEHFVLGFRGFAIPDWVREFEREFGLGGLILFDRDVERGGPRNIEGPDQVRALCAEIHSLTSHPLVLIDQEGGKVRRLKPAAGFRELPSAADFAQLPPGEARRLARESFAEMKQLGIDFDLAPVVDLNTNPLNPNIGAIGRSFSADPEVVRRCVRLLSDEARAVGLGLCLKHYPGLGGATVDSHLALTDITSAFSDAQRELFVELCGETFGSAILLSHGLVRSWDERFPVSVSEPAIRALRAALPDALLVTDDLQMKGLQAICTTEVASLRALAAGIDLLCIGNNLLVQQDECFRVAAQLRAQLASDAALAGLLARSRERIRSRKQLVGAT
jgi:beta-N-acetylhexosaminidase